MAIEDIERLIEGLHWDGSAEVQEEAIRTLSTIRPSVVGDLIPGKGKKYFHNSVKVVAAVGYPENRAAIRGLLFLLQDLSWPGAQEGFDLMMTMKKEDLMPEIEKALVEAHTQVDTIWIAWIRSFVERRGIAEADFVNKECVEYLKTADW